MFLAWLINFYYSDGNQHLLPNSYKNGGNQAAATINKVIGKYVVVNSSNPLRIFFMKNRAAKYIINEISNDIICK